VKAAIQVRKVAYKAWLQNKFEPSLHLPYAEAQKYAPSLVEMSKIKLWGNFRCN